MTTIHHISHIPPPRPLSPLILISPSALQSFSPFLAPCLLASVLWLCAAAPQARAQYETQVMTMIDQTPIVFEAPEPYVEASRILPDVFAKLRANVGAANRLIALFIPRLSVKDLLDGKTDRYRSMRAQVQRDMEPVRYGAGDLKKMSDEYVRGGVAGIGINDSDTLFSVLNLDQFKRDGMQKILGLATLGEDSYTLCIASSAEGIDARGARQIVATVSCVTHVLIKDKILTLTVSSPEISAPELDNVMHMTAKWISLLRAANPAPAKPSNARPTS